jgi:AcrR family transcriptional regulator
MAAVAAAQAPDPKDLKRTRGGRERLLTAAADLFRTHTLAGTSLQMIADRLGVSKPAIYHHFRSRDDIVATLMEPVLADAGAAATDLLARPAADRPAAARAFYAEFVVRHREVIALVFFDRAALPDDLPGTVDRLVDQVADALAGDGGTDARDAGTALVYGLAALVTRRQDLDDDALRTAVGAALGVLSGDGPGAGRRG